ncbi:GntR family transcriptional regulator [Antarctobacter sp.]|uniref:GntR family transcriptional regulator n=1 Tax=Antarctobacter sp. TaxID=1872577 RepID=UPI002B26EE88|nr:GntR family transcriptional regulator [Antarctobacter sp.]
MPETGKPSQAATAIRKSAVARYLQLAALFRRRIETNEWPVDSRIPTVEELAKECGVANMTIRQALSLLEQEGLIERFRAKGTFVRKRNSRDLWCEVQTDWNGLLMARDNAEIELLSSETGTKPTDYPAGISDLAESYLHLKRRHRREGEAFLLADVFIDERLSSKIDKAHFTSKTSMRLIADIPGLKIVDARQILTIGSADPEISELLGVSLGDPVAYVQRIAVAEDGTMALIANGIYRGDMVRVEIKLT